MEGTAHFRLLDQPIELVRHTVEQLHPNDDRKALYNLCLTCRVLRTIAQPGLFIWSEAPLPIRCGEGGEGGKWFERMPAKRGLATFKRSIVQRPDLTSATRDLDLCIEERWENRVDDHEDESLNPRAASEDTGDQVEYQIQPEDNSSFSQAAAESLPTAVDWKVQVRESGFWALLSLLLCRLPNVQHLSYEPLHGYGLPDSSLFTLNHVQPTCLVVLWDRKNVSAEFPLSFLKSFRALKSFTFGAPHMECNYFLPEDLNRALDSQIATLERLYVDLSVCRYDEDIKAHVESGNAATVEHLIEYGSFQRFAKLRCLTIDSVRLGSLQNLPQNIEELLIRDVSNGEVTPRTTLAHFGT
ncbi:hypothetical protein K458DRAFT_449220 [Lentithecium fluviatile CBS 122367]|uniref:F-box domain-containing protein n=1 Tax=Lentithecium fluviatile CBS 122367 TaxID=1168545 RepID=A0A6G1JQ82_9PLEO|nr:hypothetical protein K458DRAFT_449220 [Lentithecium fluviatile CBS 122367]